MADLEARLLDRARAVAAFLRRDRPRALYGLARLEKRELGVDDSLIYEDEPDPIVRSLELG